MKKSASLLAFQLVRAARNLIAAAAFLVFYSLLKKEEKKKWKHNFKGDKFS
jgi:hypothetical protein